MLGCVGLRVPLVLLRFCGSASLSSGHTVGKPVFFGFQAALSSPRCRVRPESFPVAGLGLATSRQGTDVNLASQMSAFEPSSSPGWGPVQIGNRNGTGAAGPCAGRPAAAAAKGCPSGTPLPTPGAALRVLSSSCAVKWPI